MKWGNYSPKYSKNNLSMKCGNSKYYRYVCGASLLCIGLMLLIGGCSSKEINLQLVQPANESWKEIQKISTTDGVEFSDITIRINSKLKENVAFMKPSKFDEHVEEEQYVDNPLLLMGINSSTTSMQPVNVTNTLNPQPIISANQSTKLNQTRACNENIINVTRCNLQSGNTTTTDRIQLSDVDSTNDSFHSALVRKRNSASQQHSSELFNNKNINNKNNLNSSNNARPISTTPIYYNFKSSNELGLKNVTKALINIKNNNDTKLAYAHMYTQVAYAAPQSPKYYHKSYLNQGNMYNFKLKKETEDYRMLEKRIRRQNRVRRSLSVYQLPFNDVIYHHHHHHRRPQLRRRYYLPEDRIDYWDQYADQQRRFVRFPLQTDAFRTANRPLNQVPPPPPPPPPVAPIGWTSPQLPQYAAYHQNLPPVPSMGPRSPRLVFRDPVEPGTVQAPFSPNGLQDIAAPDDNRDDWPDVDDGNENRLCPTGSCEFFLTCWMSSGLIEGACGGGFLYACCLRNNNGKATDRGANSITSNDIQLPSNYGPVINDPRCGVSVAKQQTAQRRIVGGDEAGFGNFPWQAYIRIGSSRCGGTLVNRYHVVTAGHCVARATARQVQVTLGDYVINSAVEPLPAYTFGVRKINVHPYFKFTPQADRFDVAVLRLDRPVQYMPHIAPICLPEKDEDFLDKYAWAAGWGALQAGSRLRPKTLQAVDVPIIDNRQCERWHKSNGINVVIYDEMMCAGYRGGLKDSCQGDSGGPLMLEKTGRWYLIGIVSAGYSCAQRGQPGIYHRVAHTVDWISYIINS